MTKKVEERLQELLDQKDSEIESLRDELSEKSKQLENRERIIENLPGGWNVIDTDVEDEPDLPVPRLEVRWHQMYEGQDKDDWSNYRITSCLITGQITSHLKPRWRSIPLGMSVVRSSMSTGRKPWEVHELLIARFEKEGRPAPRVEMPSGIAIQVHHDAFHLRVAAYAMLPDGTRLRIDGDEVFNNASMEGRKGRRE